MEPDLDRKPATLFHRAVTALHPGAGGRTIAKLLDSKIDRTTALSWRRGHRAPPRWALDMLADKIQTRADELAAIAAEARQEKERPGLKAGALNLAKWRARQKP